MEHIVLEDPSVLEAITFVKGGKSIASSLENGDALIRKGHEADHALQRVQSLSQVDHRIGQVINRGSVDVWRLLGLHRKRLEISTGDVKQFESHKMRAESRFEWVWKKNLGRTIALLIV
ncbi:uncharacterized protein N7506_001537 [Penicillium brevicompactum]|uniref:uncharacterized protein n=1 Tax=Penicillium brevicompactum TaxID=5074 RepID=UPI0025401AD9|nr:uncharacterized protein N7506_001537 [Penicillium brevicompactum]KAJ5348284.1 hypothetical protein N7506_001537 [Penicillium brevicompactum]